jgi:hypothetical protein
MDPGLKIFFLETDFYGSGSVHKCNTKTDLNKSGSNSRYDSETGSHGSGSGFKMQFENEFLRVRVRIQNAIQTQILTDPSPNTDPDLKCNLGATDYGSEPVFKFNY